MINDDVVPVEFEITTETAKKVSQLVNTHLWDKEKGLRIIFGCGLGFLLAEEIANKNKSDEVIGLSRELALSEGKLAATAYELADYKKLVHGWELSSGSIKSMGVALEKLALDQREEISELKKQKKELSEEIEKLRAQSRLENTNATSITAEKKSWFSQIIYSNRRSDKK